MKNMWLKREKNNNDNNLLPYVIMAFVIGFGLFGVKSASRYNVEEEQRLLKDGIEKNIKLCYAIEGIYPPNIQYLEENYNVEYDHKKYIIHYDVYASNVPPEVNIYRRDYIQKEHPLD